MMLVKKTHSQDERVRDKAVGNLSRRHPLIMQAGRRRHTVANQALPLPILESPSTVESFSRTVRGRAATVRQGSVEDTERGSGDEWLKNENSFALSETKAMRDGGETRFAHHRHRNKFVLRVQARLYHIRRFLI